MKRKTSQKTRLSCQTDVLHIKRKRKRSRPAVVLSLACSSYLVKFLGIVTRLVR